MKIFKRVCLAFALLAGLAAILLLFAWHAPFPRTEAFRPEDYRYGASYRAELEDIPVMAQSTAHTCAAVSMAIVGTHQGQDATEEGLLTALGLAERGTGMLPGAYLHCANEALAPLSASLVNPTSRAEILNVISGSLEAGMPVVIFYAAPDDWNPPHHNTHYAVVYGIDVERGAVKLSNPYGYLEELSFEALYEGLDFTSYAGEPLSFRLARRVGMVKGNNLFVFEKNA